MGLLVLLLLSNPVSSSLKEQTNTFQFRVNVYPIIKRNECGACKKACHFDPKDRGGVTCFGIAINRNPDFFVKEMNTYEKSCKVFHTGDLLCNRSTMDTNVANFYFKKYGKPFRSCDAQVFKMVIDTAILSGVSTAKRFLRKINKNYKKACTKKYFNAKKFTRLRIKRFKTLVTCETHCRGWTLRAERMLKEYKNGR